MDLQKAIKVNPEKCTGCRICELICSADKHSEFNPKRSRVRIVKMERFFIDIPTVCQQCSKPLCLKSCDSGAIEKTDNGVMVVDREKCTGCGDCVSACPFDAIFLDPVDDKAIVCDLCQGNPKCVQWCPTEALTLQLDIPEKDRKKPGSTIKEARQLVKRWKLPLDEWEQYDQPRKSNREKQ